jgi:hypothetical protein
MEQGRVILQELTMLPASGSGGNVPYPEVTGHRDQALQSTRLRSFK